MHLKFVEYLIFMNKSFFLNDYIKRDEGSTIVLCFELCVSFII